MRRCEHKGGAWGHLVPPDTCSRAATSRSIMESTSLIAALKFDLRIRAASANKGPKGERGISSSAPAMFPTKEVNRLPARGSSAGDAEVPLLLLRYLYVGRPWRTRRGSSTGQGHGHWTPLDEIVESIMPVTLAEETNRSESIKMGLSIAGLSRDRKYCEPRSNAMANGRSKCRARAWGRKCSFTARHGGQSKPKCSSMTLQVRFTDCRNCASSVRLGLGVTLTCRSPGCAPLGLLGPHQGRSCSGAITSHTSHVLSTLPPVVCSSPPRPPSFVVLIAACRPRIRWSSHRGTICLCGRNDIIPGLCTASPP